MDVKNTFKVMDVKDKFENYNFNKTFKDYELMVTLNFMNYTIQISALTWPGRKRNKSKWMSS